MPEVIDRKFYYRSEKLSSLLNTIKMLVRKEMEFSEPTRAKVIRVDESALSATVVDTADEQAEYDAVLRSTSIFGAESGIVPIPVVGSIVVIEFIDSNPSQAFVSKFSEIEKFKIISETEIVLESNGHSIVIDSEGIKYTDTAGEPMVKGQSLINYLSGLDAVIQSLLAWAETGVAPGPQGGISPLAGVVHTPATNDVLSQKGKIS